MYFNPLQINKKGTLIPLNTLSVKEIIISLKISTVVLFCFVSAKAELYIPNNKYNAVENKKESNKTLNLNVLKEKSKIDKIIKVVKNTYARNAIP